MNPRSNKTLIERFIEWWRGLFAQPSRDRQSMSGRRESTDQHDDAAVLGDLPDSERVDRNASESRYGTAGRASGAGTSTSAKPDRATAASGANADIAQQDDTPSATGASDDEFAEGGYSTTHVDQNEVEDAAQTGNDDVPSDAPGATGSFRSMTGGNVPADDSGRTVGGSTSAAEDSGSVASRGSGLDDPATIESETPTMPGSGSSTDVDRTGPAGVTDFEDASGTEDTSVSDTLGGSDRLDEANSVHDAVGERERGVDATQRSADKQNAELDKSMQGDTDYVTAGYPSEAMDIDITDTDDLGVQDAESSEDVVSDDADDDAADFSKDAGDLGLADSETVDDGVPDTGKDESGFTPVSSDDVGVGDQAEVDDTSLIASSDDATSADVTDATSDDSSAAASERDSAASPATGAAAAAASRAGGSATGPAGSVRGDGTTETPEGYPIKGNASSKIYHSPGMPSYAGTKPEWCFATEEDAIAAGYRAPAGRNRGQKRDTTSQSGSASSPAGGAAASGGVQAGASHADASTGQDAGTGEGVQSYASTADRDALADMQDTLAEEPDTTGAADAQGLGGLGSDPSAADDPTSVGTTAFDAGKVPGGTGDSTIADTASAASGSAGGLASASDDDQKVSAEADSGDLAASDTAAFMSETADPAQAPASDVSSMQTDTLQDAAQDTGLPAETDEPEGIGVAAQGDEQTYAGAVRGDGTRTCPTDYPIKGNAGSMIYHAPGKASYDNTIAEWCFATEEDAVNAGFRAPKR